MKFSLHNVIKNALLGVFASFTFVQQTQAQCPVEAFANPTSIVCGKIVSLSAIAEGCKPLNNNFNGGSIGSDWSATNGAVVTTGVCGAPAEGANYLWMGSDVAAPRQVKTNNYNLSSLCPGAVSGNICFYMKYAVQGQSSPCEGIDLPEEGVSVQYSTNNGVTWNTIQYFDPNGGSDPVLTNWKKYCFNLPPGAITTATQFRWYQGQSSGAGFDTWGLDEMILTMNNPSYTFDWAHDAQAPANSALTPDVQPVNTTTYTVTYTDGSAPNTCTSSVTVTVLKPTVSASATPSTICEGANTQLNVVSNLRSNPPTACALVTDIKCTPFSQVSDEKRVGTGTYVSGFNGDMQLFGGGASDAAMTHQILFRASELTAAGVKAGKLTYLNYFVNNIQGSFDPGTSRVIPRMNVGIKCTNLNTMTALQGGINTVYTGTNINVTTGTNTIFFDKGYEWDGSTNIILQFCLDMEDGRSGQAPRPFLVSTNMGYNCFITKSSNDFYGESLCSQNLGGAANLETSRPNFDFGFCRPNDAVILYDWTSNPSGFTSSIRNPLDSPAGNTEYTVMVNQVGYPAGCAVAASTNVTVVKGPIIGDNKSRCGTGTVPLTATGFTH
jgi:hypothetical protein